jgi:hyaluronoglucosaminidase
MGGLILKSKMIRKLLATAMATVFIINGLTVTKIDAVTNNSTEVERTLPNLNPVPQNIEINDGVLTITSSVNIKGSDVADEDAIRILNEFLVENNITVNETYDEASTTLIIGEVEDDIADMDTAKEKLGIEDTVELEEEGYVLAVDNSKGKGGTILIEGKDGDGTFYGVKTLTQLAESDGGETTVTEVKISDEPTMRTRGIVEGFYGNPWTHQDRLNQIEFYGEHKMNTYIYAPKDDPYHREQWRAPYPESEMSRMSELIETSKKNKVDFVFAISPGIDIRFDGDAGEEDFQALINKCQSLYDMGVRSFAILFDDISNKDGIKQATLLNRFNEEFVKVKGDVKPLITVPTEYDTHSMGRVEELNPYTRDFSSTLDSDIMVMWTGPVVVSEGIDLENAQFVNSIYGKRMGVWWNYPVTDYMKEKLALGPIYNADKALKDEVDFFTMNPMEHAEFSKIALATGAAYSWNTEAYDYDKAWNKAIEMLYGDLAEEMKVFANHSTRMEGGWASTGRADAPEVRANMDSLLKKLAKGQDASYEIDYLYKEFDSMINAADKLNAELPSEVLSRCKSNLDKLKLLGENDKLALDMLIALVNNNESEVYRIKSILNDNMSKLNSGAKVSEKTALAFINEALAFDPYPVAGFNISSTFVATGEEVTFTSTSSLSAVDMEWTFEGANIETSREENPTVTYAEEGIYSVSLKVKNPLGEDEIVKEGLITVSNAAKEEKINLSLGKTAIASSFVAPGEAPRFAIDGDVNTKWCASGNGTHTLTIDLGTVSTISDVIIKHAEAGAESPALNTLSYRIQVSSDGQNYKEVLKVDKNNKAVTNNPIPVTKGRYVKLLVDKPAQNSDKAARIYEVEIMGLNKDIELPPIYGESGDNKEPIVYPIPQKTKYLSKEGMSLTGEVNVVVHGDQEKSTITKLDEILKKNDIEYAVSDNIDENKANIVITSDKNHCDECVDDDLVNDKALKNKEGYVLKTSDDDNKNGDITIIGSDKDGAYYGVLSLGQILEKGSDDKFAEVVISDYPEIEFRGFIEGFYGIPWSHEERISLMKDTSEYKMNTYIYAPKDDPYHRKDWKKLYPEDKAQEIKELAAAGAENNFNFCWTIHPGATLKFTDEDFNALINKFEQLYDLGVRQFGVLFDDTDDWTNGKKQAEWINRIDTEFVKAKGDIAPMIVISARYNSAWGPSMNNYFKPFMQTLHEDIQVMWTGHATMSNVSRDVFEWPKIQTGVDKDMAVWWNYPVNDYCDSRLLMAPLHNLNKDLDNVSGFFSNPMNQAEASKVALYSIADYTWNTDSFDYMKSWETSIEKLVPEAKEEFMRFASNTSYLKDSGGDSGPFEYDESWYLTDKINNLSNSIANNESIIEPANALLDEFKFIISDYDKIVSNINNKNLLEETQVFLDAYKALGEAGVAAMESLIAAEEGKIENWLNKNNLAKEKLDLMESYKVKRAEDNNGNLVEVEYVVAVGEKRLKPIIKDAIRLSNTILSKSIFVDEKAKAIGTLDGIDNINVKFENGSYSIDNVTGVKLGDYDYIGIALPKATKLSEVAIEASDYDGLALEYSLNGLEWQKAETTVEDNIMKTTSNVAATYVRLVSTNGDTKVIDITRLITKPVYKANPSISQNIGQYQSYSIDKALDGNMDTKYWSDKATSKGHYIQVDLGNKIPLYDVTSYFGNMDYMRNSEYLISEDGINWTSLGDLQFTDEGGKKVATANAEGKMTRYIRIKANGENSGYWIQLYELEFNKTVPDFGDDYVELVTGSPAGRWDALYDRDLSTAFEADEVSEGDALVYKMTRTTKVEEIMFLQDLERISKAKISVKNTEGNWREVGSLEEQLTTLIVNEEILEVKLEFDSNKPAPKIYEIIVKENTNINVFKEHLKIAVEEANKITEEDLENVVPVVVEEFKKALEEAEAVLSNLGATQDSVDKAFDRLSKAMHMLSFKKGDKEHLIALVDRINKLDKNEFIASTWDKLQFALDEANAIINDSNAMEKEVAESYDKLMRAFLELRLKPNKDKLEGLINKAEGLDSTKYTKKSWKNVEKALIPAKKVFADEDVTEKEIAKAEKDLVVALTNLVVKGDSNNSGNNNNGNNNPGNNKPNKDNGKGGKLPSTGAAVSSSLILLLGAGAVIAGGVTLKKRKREE